MMSVMLGRCLTANNLDNFKVRSVIMMTQLKLLRIFYRWTILEHIFYKLFKSFSSYGATDSQGKLFLKRSIFLHKSISYKPEFNFKSKFI